jgi:hypothetical protein
VKLPGVGRSGKLWNTLDESGPAWILTKYTRGRGPMTAHGGGAAGAVTCRIGARGGYLCRKGRTTGRAAGTAPALPCLAAAAAS